MDSINVNREASSQHKPSGNWKKSKARNRRKGKENKMSDFISRKLQFLTFNNERNSNSKLSRTSCVLQNSHFSFISFLILHYPLENFTTMRVGAVPLLSECEHFHQLKLESFMAGRNRLNLSWNLWLLFILAMFSWDEKMKINEISFPMLFTLSTQTQNSTPHHRRLSSNKSWKKPCS